MLTSKRPVRRTGTSAKQPMQDLTSPRQHGKLACSEGFTFFKSRISEIVHSATSRIQKLISKIEDDSPLLVHYTAKNEANPHLQNSAEDSEGKEQLSLETVGVQSISQSVRDYGIFTCIQSGKVLTIQDQLILKDNTTDEELFEALRVQYKNSRRKLGMLRYLRTVTRVEFARVSRQTHS